MKLILYSIPNCIYAKAIKIFLEKNNLPFKEIIVDSEEKKREAIIAKQGISSDISFLKIVNSHSIHIITGYNEFALNQLIEHIKKYNPKIKI